MAIEIADAIHAACGLDGTTPAFTRNSGFSSFVKNSVGDYSLILTEEIAALESIVLVTCETAPVRLVRAARPSASEVLIRAFDTSQVAADCFVAVLVIALPVVS